MRKSCDKQWHGEEHVASHNDKNRHGDFPLDGRVFRVPYLDAAPLVVGVVALVLPFAPLVFLGS